MVLTLNKINEIIDYHNKGITVRKIAKKAHISKNTVQKYISKYHNNDLSLLTKFPEKNLYKMIPTPVSYQKRQDFIQPQEHPDFHLLEVHLLPPQYRREREEAEDEQRRKVYQEEQEKSHRSRMKLLREEGERKQQEEKQTLAVLHKIDQDNRKYNEEKNKNNFEFNKKMNQEIKKVEEIIDKKTQDWQKFMESIPRIVREEMKKSQARKSAIQKDKNQKHNPTFTVLKRVEKEINTESDNSDVLGDVILGVLPVISKIIGFYQSPDSNIPLDSPEHWYRFSKYVKKDMKHET